MAQNSTYVIEAGPSFQVKIYVVAGLQIQNNVRFCDTTIAPAAVSARCHAAAFSLQPAVTYKVSSSLTGEVVL